MSPSASSSSSSSSQHWQPWPPEALTVARTALDLTRQDWSLTGQDNLGGDDNDNNNPSNGSSGGYPYRHPTLAQLGDRVGVEEIVERMVALLLIRMVALVTCRLGNTVAPTSTSMSMNENNSSSNNSSSNSKGGNNNKRKKIYSDYSTTTICKLALQLNQQPQRKSQPDSKDEKAKSQLCDDLAPPELTRHSSEPKDNKEHAQQRAQRRGSGGLTITNGHQNHSTTNNKNANDNNELDLPPFPRIITPLVISQLRHYVGVICGQYHTPTEVPYHNVEHAYHVFLSANKLLDLMLCETPEELGNPSSASVDNTIKKTGVGGLIAGRRGRRRGDMNSLSKPKPRPTFGIKSDPLSQLAFLFSALVHDVDHTGISNRQLVLEMDDLAILYNDQSVAEQRSLAVAFTTLKREKYEELRKVLFPRNVPPMGGPMVTPPPAGFGNEDFFKFRKLVIDLVLVTDIASPERTQIVKSKWKEAFGDVIVAEKLKKSVLKKGNSFKLTRRSSVDSGRGRDATVRSMLSRYDPASNNNNPIPLTVTKEETPTDVGGGDKTANDDDNGGGLSASAIAKLQASRLMGRPKYVKSKSQENIEENNGAGASGGNNNSSKPTKGGRPKYVRNNSQSTIDSIDNGSSSSKKLTSGRPKFVRNSSQSSLDSRSKRATRSGSFKSNAVLSSSLLSTDCDSIRDSVLDCDSIDFSQDSDSSNSSFMSDIQSLEDDFDASAVSRTKMNFDKNCIFNGSSNSNSNNSKNSVSDGNSDDNADGQQGSGGLRKSPTSGSSGPSNHITGRSGGRRGHPAPSTSTTPANPSGSSNAGDAAIPNRDKRWSTGDITTASDEDAESSDQQLGPLLQQACLASSPSTSPVKYGNGGNRSDGGDTGRRKPNRAQQQQQQGSNNSSEFKVTPIIHNKNKINNSDLVKNHRRRNTHSARNGGLSQSMLTHRELAGRRPRARSEERRLGVRRALDLAGSTIIAYSGSLRGSTSSNEQHQGALTDSGIGGGTGFDEDLLDADDDIDEFKATVVLEQMIRAADVAALLQDWDNSMKWSTRLYRELKNGFLANRGEEPDSGWYENQIKFFDFYILPLAKNLGVMGVFEEKVAAMFVGGVKGNLDKWLVEGSRATELMMKDDQEERRKDFLKEQTE